jgi:bacillithiol system protein YtxJ
MLIGISLLLLVLTGNVGIASDTPDRSNKERLVAKNQPGQNWEGPHVPELMTVKSWTQVLEKSKSQPIFVFKHSTTCGISARAAFRVNEWLKDAPKSTPEFHFVIVRARRPVSNAIEKDLQVKHESPQLLLIRDGKSIWDSDHNAITAESIEKALRAIQ